MVPKGARDDFRQSNDPGRTERRSAHVARVAVLESAPASQSVALATAQSRVAELVRERNKMRSVYDRLRLELELLKRRIFVAKAERIDTAQLELEFQDKLRPPPCGVRPHVGRTGMAQRGPRRRRPATGR